MARKINILWTQSGCIKCEDCRNAGLYERITNLKEHSLEDSEGLSLACFYEMWDTKNEIKTPSLYIGKDKFGDEYAIRIAGDEVGDYLEFIFEKETI